MNNDLMRSRLIKNPEANQKKGFYCTPRIFSWPLTDRLKIVAKNWLHQILPPPLQLPFWPSLGPQDCQLVLAFCLTRCSPQLRHFGRAELAIYWYISFKGSNESPKQTAVPIYGALSSLLPVRRESEALNSDKALMRGTKTCGEVCALRHMIIDAFVCSVFWSRRIAEFKNCQMASLPSYL